MLFLLTGDVQIGKTRWLCAQCEELAGAGVPVAGVVAPGVWRARAAGEPGGRHGFDGAGRFEKLGIDNVLLPGGERVAFARRRDLAEDAGAFDEGSQAAAAQLSWAISDEAIERVNGHFAALAKGDAPVGVPGLLVVDELGRLELLCEGGLTAAMALLDAGPTPRFFHALAVVRDWLVPHARRRFGDAWGEVREIGPDEAGAAALAAACAARPVD